MIELNDDCMLPFRGHDENINKANKKINKPKQVVRTLKNISVRLYENFR